jgi:hypothetical protein
MSVCEIPRLAAPKFAVDQEMIPIWGEGNGSQEASKFENSRVGGEE